jgi:hypothetical protein
MSKRALEVELRSVKFLRLSVPQSRLFTESSRLGVPASRYEEVRLKRPKVTRVYEELAKVITE